MQLLTQQIIQALPAIYATDAIPLKDKIVICKFFTPDAPWTWFVFEGERLDDNDYEFFGMVHGHIREMGYFRLSELQKIRGRLGLPTERDWRIFKIPYRDLVKPLY